MDFFGTANVQHLSRHKEGDRIQLDRVTVRTPKDEATGKYFTNYICWEFKDADGGGGGKQTKASKPVDSGEIEIDDPEGDDYPFD